MKTARSNAVIPILLSSIATKKYTFREITERAELKRAFRLRYDVYEASENNVLLKKNRHKIDINIYDLHAKHYGLFMNDDNLVGYLRVVLDREEYYDPMIFDLGVEIELFTEREHSFENLIKHSSADLPFINFPFVPQIIKSNYEVYRSKNERLFEAGRIALHRDCRSLRASIFLIECAIALYVINNIDYNYAIICCSSEHGRFYKRYGFDSFGEERSFDIHGTKKVSMSLSLSLSSIPEQFHAKFEEMACEFKISGKIQRAIN